MLTQTFVNYSSAYNPYQLDAYLLHIADMHTSCSVFAAEDIYSNQHKLLIADGVQITPVLALTLISFTLLKPLDECLRFTYELDAIQLEDDFINVMQNDNVLLAVNEYCNFTLLLKTLCQSITAHSLLRKKLTVMACVMPETYQRSLYCAWLSLLIAKEMRLSWEDISSVFVAALIHDIGMLHIDAGMINREASRTTEEWLHIQNHTLIGAKIVSLIPEIQPAILQAIYEHHERCDGTGYPLGRVESELGLHGQIVGLADSVMAIYYHRFKSQGRNWCEAVPVIQMNTQAYLYRALEVLMSIVRRSELPQKKVINANTAPEFVNNLMRKNQQLKYWFESMRDCIMSIGFRHGDRQLHALQNVMLHISTSVEGSGIFNPQLNTIFNAGDLDVDNKFYQEIESVYLIQQEIAFHLQRLNFMTQLYLDSGECKKADIKVALLAGLSRAQQYIL